MADYRSILDRAINGLANNTEETRRAIYEKARGALMRQLSSLQPALSPAEISKQRLQLEEAVRETEGQFSGVGALEDAVADALTDFDIEDGANVVEAAPALPEVTPPEAVEPIIEPVVETPSVSAEVSALEPIVQEPASIEPIVPEVAEPVFTEPEPLVVDTPEIEPEISVTTPELPTVEATEPVIATPNVEINSPDINVDPAPIDIPPVDVEPTLPPLAQTTFETPAENIEVEAPTVNTDQVNIETADMSAPTVDTPDITPLDELRETMAADGVNVPPITGDFPSSSQDNFSTFEAPNPNTFDPEEAIAVAETKKSGGKGLFWILFLLILIGAGTFGWAQRESVGPVLTEFTGKVSSFISSFGNSGDSAPTPSTATQPAANTDENNTKSEDRIPTAGGTDDNIQPDTRVTIPEATPSTEPAVVTPEPSQDQSQAEEPVTPTEPATQTAQAEPALTPPAASEQTPTAPQTTTPASNLFSSSAILYEERPGSNQPTVSAGNVLWEIVPTGSEAIGSTGLPSVKGSARIESRDISVRFELMRNLDPNLPASHLIEFEFTPGPLFNGDEINNIAGVIAKPEEEKNGTQLKGAIVKVSERVFWVAMSAQAADLAANTDALQQQNWFDIPLVFKSGKRAILTLEKGAAGKKAIEEAFKSWNATN